VYVLLGRAVTEYRWGGSRNIPFMRHKFLVLTVKKRLKSVYIYGSYRKIKTGVSLFWTTLYIQYFSTIGYWHDNLVCPSVCLPVWLSVTLCVVAHRVRLGGLKLYNRVRRTALPIHFFRHSCCRMYRLTTKHSYRLKRWQASKETLFWNCN